METPARTPPSPRAWHGLSFSPDGKLLAYCDRPTHEPRTPSSIFLFSLENGERRQLTFPPAEFPEGGDLFPRFSPDGAGVAVIRERMLTQGDIYVVSAEGGEPTLPTDGGSRLPRHAPETPRSG